MESSPNDKPVLRWPLDVQCQDVAGRKLILFHDPLGVMDGRVAIPAELWPIVSRFDGSRSVQDIVSEGAAHGVTAALVERLISELKDALLLDCSAARTRWEEIKQDFSIQNVRETAFAGKSYPASADELKRWLEDSVKKVSAVEVASESPSDIVAVMAPHIDYRRGWQTYAAVYRALAETERPDVIFLIGTAHQPSEGLFHLTRKDFSSPLGVFPAARGVIDSLSGLYGFSEKLC